MQGLASNEFIFDKIYSGTLNRQQHTRQMVEEVYDAQKISFPKVIEEDRFNEYPAEEIMTSLGKYLVENNDVAANLYKKCNDSTSETERHLYFQKLFELILESWVNNDTKEVNLSISWKDWSNGVRNAIDDIQSQAKSGELIGGKLGKRGGGFFHVARSFLSFSSRAFFSLAWAAATRARRLASRARAHRESPTPRPRGA